MAQFGVNRGLAGDYPADYDSDAVYTPAWQEKFTGIDRANVIQFAREWASTAEQTEGKCSIIIGAGINHWYHANLIYRAGIVCLDALWLRRQERRWPQSLRRSGKAGAGRALGIYHGGPRLVETAAFPECTLLPLCSYRPMALRDELPTRCKINPVAEKQPDHRRTHHGSSGPCCAQRLAAVLPAVRPQPDRSGETSRSCRCQQRSRR